MRIVLVRPRDPNNIGAVARAMANFGFSDLVLVAPYAPTWQEARSAVGAATILRNARVVDHLRQAIGDCTLAGATTAGTRRTLAEVVTPEEFAAESSHSTKTALIFGNEKHGLRADEIAACHRVVTIPTSAAQPSLNLAQAVAICCYVARRTGDAGRPSRRRSARVATLGDAERLIDEAVPRADAPGVESRREGARARLRALLLRSEPTEAELQLLRGLLAPGRRVRR